jgi:fatty acid desaturase
MILIFRNLLLIIYVLLNSLLNPSNIELLFIVIIKIQYGIFGILMGLYQMISLLIVIVLCMIIFEEYPLHVYDR